MRIEDNLTLDAAAADFSVDLSNLVRNSTLCGERAADLRRLHELVRALIAFSGDESVQLYAVADDSLLSLDALTGEERATLRRWYRAGRIQVRKVADDRLLELADLTGLRVVSDDKFLDAYRTYPWIAGNRDRFLRAVPGPGGVGVAVVPRIMPTPHDWQISRKEEEGRLLAAGMYDRRRGTGARRHLLTRLWRCPEDDCPVFGADAGAGQPPPVFRRGTVRCPTHQLVLADVGPKPSRKQLKVRSDGTVKARLMLVAGTTTVVGRAPTGAGVALDRGWLSADSYDRISREHVELSWDGQTISLRDLSRNGVWVRRDGNPGMGRRVPKDRTWKLRTGEVIVLCAGVELVASGRTYVFDEGDEAAPGPDSIRAAAGQETIVRGPATPQ